jgi:hypothetical protein
MWYRNGVHSSQSTKKPLVTRRVAFSLWLCIALKRMAGVQGFEPQLPDPEAESHIKR